MGLKWECSSQAEAIYKDLDNLDRMTELTELGLTIEAAREMIERAQEIEAVNRLLDKKKKNKNRE